MVVKNEFNKSDKYLLLPILILSIVGACLVYSFTWPEERQVDCNYKEHSLISNQPLIQTLPYIYQWIVFAFGIILWVAMIVDTELKTSAKENFNWPTLFRYATLFIVGLCITSIITILMSNASGKLSPGFIDACKPAPSIEQLCKGKIGTVNQVKVNCTTNQSQWIPARSAMPHQMTTIIFFITMAWNCWASYRILDPVDQLPWYARTVSFVPMVLSLVVAIGQAEADYLDILLSYVWTILGFIIVAIMAAAYNDFSLVPEAVGSKTNQPV